MERTKHFTVNKKTWNIYTDSSLGCTVWFRLHKPLWGPEAAGAEEVPDGARGRQLCVTRVKHHAEVFGDHCRLSAVLHLVKIHRNQIPFTRRQKCKRENIDTLKKKQFPNLQISRQGDVDLLPIGSDSVQEKRVVHGAVPCCLKSVERPEREKKTKRRHWSTCFF